MRDLETSGRLVVDLPRLEPTPLAEIATRARRRRRRSSQRTAAAVVVLAVVGGGVAFGLRASHGANSTTTTPQLEIAPPNPSTLTDVQVQAHLGTDAPAGAAAPAVARCAAVPAIACPDRVACAASGCAIWAFLSGRMPNSVREIEKRRTAS